MYYFYSYLFIIIVFMNQILISFFIIIHWFYLFVIYSSI